MDGFSTDSSVVVLAATNRADILDKALLRQINVHGKNFAVIQNQIAQQMKQIILSVTGNLEVSKDILTKTINFIAASSDEDQLDGQASNRLYGQLKKKKSLGIVYLKKLMKRFDIYKSV